MKKILFAIALSLLINGAFAQGAKQSMPANTPIEALKPGEWVWYAEAVPEGPMLMLVSIAQQKAFLYRNGIRVGVSTVSTGKKGYETPTGVFTILQKNKDHKSNLYKDSKNNAAAMPYMQRLTWDGIALHSGNLPGYPASHGCVRMPDGFAQRLFAETELGMTVIVSNDKVASPEKLSDPTMFAQSMDAEGKLRPVEPLSAWSARSRSAARPMSSWTAPVRRKAASCPIRWKCGGCGSMRPMKTGSNPRVWTAKPSAASRCRSISPGTCIRPCGPAARCC